MAVNVILLSSPAICSTSLKQTIVASHDASLDVRTVGNLKVSPFGCALSWKRHKRKYLVMVMKKSFDAAALMGGKSLNGVSAEELTRVLKSISDPTEALSLFKSSAQLPNLVHSTETCNYMLELLRVNNRIGDMAIVFDLMQKQIIYRSLTTYLTIFKGLDIKGGIQHAPVALTQMSKVGFVLNGYSYNGLIHLVLQSGFIREALEVYGRQVSEGIVPSLKTYSALMVAFGKRRDIENVLSLLNEMESLGLRPNVYTFTICIRAWEGWEN